MKIVKIGNCGGNQYIKFDNGEMLTANHWQECCEYVYADFENMQVMGVQPENFVWANELDFFENVLDSIVPIAEVGFYLVSKQGICILVSCYNEQNGYYSSDLELGYMGKKMDISECVEDRFY